MAFLDMEKAYDRMNWKKLFQVMIKMLWSTWEISKTD